MAISPHSNETQTQWDRGNFQVMIKSTTSDKPIGFCEGSAQDEESLIEQANQEGVEVRIDKKSLKTGREIWTVCPVAEL